MRLAVSLTALATMGMRGAHAGTPKLSEYETSPERGS
jgi:hypothetical protein